eukprot:354286-Chlamydomonas_euryale.AAC.4
MPRAGAVQRRLPPHPCPAKQATSPSLPAGVTRALCTAFPAGHEPALCNDAGVSDNECNASGVGRMACRVDDPAAQGRNRCINTFLGAGYQCQCGQVWVHTASTL